MENKVKESFVEKHFHDEGNYLIATELDSIDVVAKVFTGFASAYHYLKQIIRSYHCNGYIIDVDRGILFLFDVRTIKINECDLVLLDERGTFKHDGKIPYISNFWKSIDT